MKISKTIWGRKKKEKEKRGEPVKRRFFPRSRRCYWVSQRREYCRGIKKSLSDYVSPVPHKHVRARVLQTTRWKSWREASTSVSRKVSAAGGSEKSWLPSNHLRLNATTLSRGRLSFKVSRIYTQLLPPRSPDYPSLATASCSPTRLFFPSTINTAERPMI